MTINSDSQAVASILRNPQEIRNRCNEILAMGERGALPHFYVHTDKLDDVAGIVADVTRQRYPGCDIPIHSRWRHFEVGGIDRWKQLASEIPTEERARVALDLVIPSVLLDAGAGDTWCYHDSETDLVFCRSEGIAVASFHAFASGGFSSDSDQPLRTDADGLLNFDIVQLAKHFQVDDTNTIEGIEGRTQLLHSLGQLLKARKDIFGDPPRLGCMYDYFLNRDCAPVAADVLYVILDTIAPIWPGRIQLSSTNLGDVWRHSAVRREDETDQLVPFHKLSQWLTYSLLEPFADGGIHVQDLDALTGLAEYRNGGLFIDGDVLVPRDPQVLDIEHLPESEIIVEWRALTVALLDRLVPLVCDKLALKKTTLSLAAMLEGGTWAAGRRLAKRFRSGGGPPLRLVSDGTVF